MNSKGNASIWKALASFIGVAFGLAVIITWVEQATPPRLSPDERHIREAADSINTAIGMYVNDHARYPTSLTELPQAYFPAGFNTSVLSRFTFTSKHETTDTSTSFRYTLERIF